MNKTERYKFLEEWVRGLCPITKLQGFDEWIKGFENRYSLVDLELMRLVFNEPPLKRGPTAKSPQSLDSKKEVCEDDYPLIGLSLEEVTHRHILKILESCDGNKRKASKILGITEKTLYNKLTKWGVHNPKKINSYT